MAKTSLVDQTAKRLKVYIEVHNMEPGDKLPNEYELSKKLEVGRNTVREAVRFLASRNILIIKQGSGTFIADNTGIVDDPFGFSFTSNQDKLVQDLMQIRLMVEPQIAALAAENATTEEIGKLREIAKRIELAIEDKVDFSEIDKEFHSHLSNICGNDVISKLIPIITEGVVAYAHAVENQEYQQTIKSHMTIIRAIEHRKPKEAEQAMHFHLLYNKYRY